MARHSLLLGSVHDYHDLQHFIDELQHVEQVWNITCRQVKGKHHFRLSFDATDGDNAALNLTKAMQSYTDDSRWDLYDDAVDLKVSMTSDARLKEELDEIYDMVDRMDPSVLDEGARPTQNAFLIHHESVKKAWTIDSKTPPALLAPPFVARLEAAWKVRIEVLDMVVIIYADSREELETSVEGFNACRDVMIGRANRRHFFDFHNDEDEVNQYYRFRQPPSTADFELATRRFLENYVELVMVRWDEKSVQFKSVELPPSPVIADSESRLWPLCFDFEFGDHRKVRRVLKRHNELNITNLPPINGMRMDTTTRRNEQVKSWLATNPHGPSAVEGDHAQEHDTTASSSKPSSVDVEINVQHTIAAAVNPKPGTDTPRFEELAKTGFVRPSRFGARYVEEVVEGPLPSVPRLIGPDGRLNMPSIPKASADGGFTTIDGYDSDGQQMLDLLSFPPLKAKKATTSESIGSDIGAWKAHCSRGVQMQGPPEMKRPAELPNKSAVAGDVRLAEPEYEKRRFQPQGSLRASNAGERSKPFDLPDEIWKALRTTLSGAKLYESTRRVLKLEIGKIFASKTSIPSQWRPSNTKPAVPFKPEHWSEIFHAHRDKGSAITAFSPRITNRPCDAHHILDLESADSTAVFKTICADGNPEECTRLQIRCQHRRQGTEVIVEVDELSSASIRTADPFLVGSVNIHFPKRPWDARVVIEEHSMRDSPTTQLFRNLIESLCVRAPRKDKHIKDPIIVANKEAQIEIVSVEFHRDVIYQVDGPAFAGIEMCLTQVQSLSVKSEPNSFAAYLLKTEETAQNRRIWWTMYLSSPSTNAALQLTAVDIRLGASPSAEAINKMEQPVKALVGLASLLVPQMDPIGKKTNFKSTSESSSSPQKHNGSSRTGRSQKNEQREPQGTSSKWS